MLLPAEIETKTSVPALRALVAKRLINEYNFSQKDTAKLIGVTQAAISNYLRGTRGNLTSLGDDERIQNIVAEITTMMIEKHELSDIILKFNEACSIIRGNRMLCDIHKKLEPSLDVDNCHVCELDYDEQSSSTQSFDISLK
jgi:predicted transcriptional regulator